MLRVIYDSRWFIAYLVELIIKQKCRKNMFDIITPTISSSSLNDFTTHSDESGLAMKTWKTSTLKRLLSDAMSRDQFELVYQPQIEITTHKVIGVEALLRWHSPELGLVAPEHFIPVAEESGMIFELGSMVIEKACAQASFWKNHYQHEIRMAINVSCLQIKSNKILDIVDSCLRKYNLSPSKLEIELTESTSVRDMIKVIYILNQFKDMGVRTTIDDFGTGYSSLSYLAHMPFDMIKIDRSFIDLLGLHTANTVVTESIIHMSKKLNMEIMAEGVETESQRTILLNNGCDYMQGYLFSRPVSADKLPEIAGMKI